MEIGKAFSYLIGTIVIMLTIQIGIQEICALMQQYKGALAIGFIFAAFITLAVLAKRFLPNVRDHHDEM